MNISLILQMAADADPDRIAIVCEGRRWSYGELHRAATGAARLFRESGASQRPQQAMSLQALDQRVLIYLSGEILLANG